MCKTAPGKERTVALLLLNRRIEIRWETFEGSHSPLSSLCRDQGKLRAGNEINIINMITKGEAPSNEKSFPVKICCSGHFSAHFHFRHENNGENSEMVGRELNQSSLKTRLNPYFVFPCG